jgi:hypothetical protein
MRVLLGFIGALIIAISALYYFVDILRGRTRPQRTSWAVWATVGVLGFGVTDEGGAGPGAWAAGVDAVACAVTFMLSLHPRYGKSGGRRIDPLLAVIGLLGVALWRWGPLSMNGAALCAVGCEIPALWPTLREAWRRPEQESLLSWSVDVFGHALALTAVAKVSLAALAYPVYAVSATLAVSAVLSLGRLRDIRTAAASRPTGPVDGQINAAVNAAVDAAVGAPQPIRIMSRPHRR